MLLKLENNYVMRQIRNSEYMERLFSDGIWDSLSDDEKLLFILLIGKVILRLKE